MPAGRCEHCGLYRQYLHRDHIVPKWAGGRDVPSNWQNLCANCHEDKTWQEQKSPAYRKFMAKAVKRGRRRKTLLGWIAWKLFRI